MQNFTPLDAHVYRARLDRSGRIVLPQPVREVLQLASGDEVLVVQTADGYRIETPEQALKAAQDYFCTLVPPGISVVDELLAERRDETRREETEEAGWQEKQAMTRPRE
ncbi:SpoVT / AbrB like domain protein [Planctomyces sp. SH-PL14]|nr:SpoVT / AbrB like domain protein [Planctomyces sp. SH-PL14]